MPGRGSSNKKVMAKATPRPPVGQPLKGRGGYGGYAGYGPAKPAVPDWVQRQLQQQATRQAMAPQPTTAQQNSMWNTSGWNSLIQQEKARQGLAPWPTAQRGAPRETEPVWPGAKAQVPTFRKQVNTAQQKPEYTYRIMGTQFNQPRIYPMLNYGGGYTEPVPPGAPGGGGGGGGGYGGNYYPSSSAYTESPYAGWSGNAQNQLARGANPMRNNVPRWWQTPTSWKF